MLTEALNNNGCRKIGEYIEKYGIYQPDTLTLRGTIADTTQITPLGLNGGRLADALEDIIKKLMEMK